MEGRSHAATGWCAGLVVAPALGCGVINTLVFAVITAGYALLPDLDHPGARAARVAGIVTEALSHWVRSLSRLVWRATCTDIDRGDGEHRALTHTLPAAVVLGVGTSLGIWFGGRSVEVGIGLMGIVLAGDALGDVVAGIVGIPALLVLVFGGDSLGTLLGVSVGLGCLVHCLGDALTRSGCPVLWPIRIRGQRWFRVGLPRRFRFHTGSVLEKRFLYPMFILCGFLLVPGVLPLTAAVVSAVM